MLPDGTLVDVFNLARGSGVQPSPNQFVQAVIRSTDHGSTWSDPIVIAQDRSVDVRDPDTGGNVRAGEGLPDIAVDRTTGNLYAVWSDGRFSGGAHSDVALSMSTDGGLTWSAPIRVNQTPAGFDAFTPSVEVAADGTVGVTYYDFRGNTQAAGVPTDYWLVHCHSSCASRESWGGEAHVAGPFDIEQAPVAGGLFLGDYEGLASVGDAFAPFFVQANGGQPANPTDAFFTTASS